MFFSPSAIIAFFFTLFLVGQVAAFPLPMPMKAALERNLKRQVDVQAPAKSDGNAVVPYKRQVDVQAPAKSDGNTVVPYKRQVDVQAPAKSDGNAVVPYKRDAGIPSQLAARSVDGVIELY